MQPISGQSNHDHQKGHGRYMEEVHGVYGHFTNNTCPEPAPGEMERGITQGLLAIPRVMKDRIPVFTMVPCQFPNLLY
jgi:hypothetical protein